MRYYSTFTSDEDILVAMSDIFLKGRWYDLDCTFSKGVFYKNIPEPTYKSDLYPINETIMQDDSTELKLFKDNTLNSIVFDPPFLFRNRKSQNNDKISKRFSYFKSFEDLLEMYYQSLETFYRKLNVGGYVFFKCQDMTDGKFYCTHYKIIEHAEKIGFQLKDIGIKISKSKLQRDAVQQNCFAKTHSYWIVLKKS